MKKETTEQRKRRNPNYLPLCLKKICDEKRHNELGPNRQGGNHVFSFAIPPTLAYRLEQEMSNRLVRERERDSHSIGVRDWVLSQWAERDGRERLEREYAERVEYERIRAREFALREYENSHLGIFKCVVPALKSIKEKAGNLPWVGITLILSGIAILVFARVLASITMRIII